MGWGRQIFSQLAGQMTYNILTSHLKKKALVTYLKTLKFVRHSLLAAVFILIALQSMVIGLIGAIVTGVWLIPFEQPEMKLYLLLGLFVLLFIVPGIFLMLFFSEKTWLRISGIENMLMDKNQSGDTH